MTVPNQLFQLSQDALVELYQLDTSPTHYLNGQKVNQGQIFCWTPGTLGDSPVYFGGVEYIPCPIDGTDWQWNGQGTVPQPKLQVMNIGGIVTGLTISLDDLIGAKVTRIRTYAKHLDGQSEADPETMFEPDIFYINRKSAHDKTHIEFELATSFEVLGRQVPARMVLRNSCRYTYRQYVDGVFVYGECPYQGENYFASDDTATGDPSKDVCSRHMSGCLARYGQTAKLPMDAFPGAGLNSGSS